MKKIMLLLVTLITMLFNQLDAQDSNAKQNDARKKMLEGIKKEKLRNPVKLESNSLNQKKNDILTEKLRGTDQKVSSKTSGNSEGESQICIDPNNPNNLALSYMDVSLTTGMIEYPVYFSSNGGSSWTKSSFSPLSRLSTDFPGYFFAGGGDPVFAYDKNGALYFSWIYLISNFSQDTLKGVMYWAKSTNNGSSFTLQSGINKYIGLSTMDPNLSAYPGSEGFYDRQWFAIDQTSGPNSNNLYVSFVYFNAPSESLALTGSTIKKLASGGTTFSAKTQAVSGAIQFNNIRVDNAGVVHLTGGDIANNKVIYCKSTNGGSSFSSPITVYSGTNLFGPSGGGYIHDRENAAVNMEVDGAKNVHVVWSDFDQFSSANYKSFYSRLNDGSSSFTTPLDLNTLFPAGKVLMPVVCAAGNRIAISAYVIDANKKGDYYIINSNDNGNIWSPALKISSGSTQYDSGSNTGAWFGDYSNSVRTDTKVYNLWSDGRSASGGSKMYVNVTSMWPTTTNDLTPVNSSLQLETIYPNPVTSSMNLNFNVGNNDEIQLFINSIDGKTVYSKNYSLTKGIEKITIDLNNMSSGQYIMKIVNKEGFEIVRNFLKSK